MPMRLFALDPETGREELWREFSPADATGVNSLIAFHSAPNGAYAYSLLPEPLEPLSGRGSP